MNNLKLTIEAARVNAGYSQEEIARKIDLTRQTISAWENGRVSPKEEHLEKFCEVCGIPRSMLRIQTKN